MSVLAHRLVAISVLILGLAEANVSAADDRPMGVGVANKGEGDLLHDDRTYDEQATRLAQQVQTAQRSCQPSKAIPLVDSSETVYLIYLTKDGIQKTFVIELSNGRFDALRSGDRSQFPIKGMGVLEDEGDLDSGKSNRTMLTFDQSVSGAVSITSDDSDFNIVGLFIHKGVSSKATIPGLFVGYGCVSKAFLTCGSVLSRTPNIASREMNEYLSRRRCRSF
jgi:hypothetical protein